MKFQEMHLSGSQAWQARERLSLLEALFPAPVETKEIQDPKEEKVSWKFIRAHIFF
jgi:hypothetical protein